MLAKLVDAVIDPGRVDVLADAVQQELIPRFLAHDGSSHGYWMSDRATGHVVAITLWDDLESLRIAAAADGAERAVITDCIPMRVLAIHAMPVLAAHVSHVSQPASPKCGSVRVTWVEGVAASERAHLPELYEDIVSDQIDSAGFCGSYWIGEANSGEGCAISMWEQPADLAGGASASRRRQRRVARTLGCRISEVREYRIIGTAGDAKDVSAEASSHEEQLAVFSSS